MKTTIAKCKVRGETRWRVRWHEAGRVHRMFFAGRTAADTKAASVNGQAVNTGRRFLALPQADQEQLLLLHDEAMKRGVSLSRPPQRQMAATCRLPAWPASAPEDRWPGRD